MVGGRVVAGSPLRGLVRLVHAQGSEGLPVELARRLQLFGALEIHQRGFGLRAHVAIDAAGAKAAIVQGLLRVAHRLGVDVGRVRR